MNVAVVELIVEPLEGPASMVVSGSVASTLKERLAGVASISPAPLRARTWNVWEPSARLGVTKGDVQAAKAPVSMRHSKVAPASFELNWKDGVRVVIVDPATGPAVIVVSRRVVQLGEESPAALAERFVGDPPERVIVKTSSFPERVLVNAIRSPAGENTGSSSTALELVSWVGLTPAAVIRKIS